MDENAHTLMYVFPTVPPEPLELLFRHLGSIDLQLRLHLRRLVADRTETPKDLELDLSPPPNMASAQSLSGVNDNMCFIQHTYRKTNEKLDKSCFIMCHFGS